MLSKMLSICPNNTNAQKIFDLIFGVIAPILCLVFDPGIIRPPNDPCLGSLTVFNRYAMFMYIAIAVGVVALIIWLMLNNMLKNAAPFFAGVFAVGVPFALTIGIVILPMSLYGLLFMGLGLLGFIPFLTALTYLRNCVGAIQITQELPNTLFFKFGFAFIGAFFTLGISLFMQYRFPIPLPTFTGGCP